MTYNHPGFTETVKQRLDTLKAVTGLMADLEANLRDGSSYAIDHADETLAHVVKTLRTVADNTEALRAYSRYPSDYSPR